MARPSNEEREIRKTAISRLMLEGYSSTAQIRDRLASEGLLTDRSDDAARSLIASDISEIKLEWRQSRLSNVTEMLGRELDKIENVERVAWEEWHNSKREQLKRYRRTKTGSEGGVEETSSEESKTMIGNPKYLERICWCIEKRVRLLGLEDVMTMEATATIRNEVDVTQIDDDELRLRLEHLLQ